MLIAYELDPVWIGVDIPGIDLGLRLIRYDEKYGIQTRIFQVVPLALMTFWNVKVRTGVFKNVLPNVTHCSLMSSNAEYVQTPDKSAT